MAPYALHTHRQTHPDRQTDRERHTHIHVAGSTHDRHCQKQCVLKIPSSAGTQPRLALLRGMTVPEKVVEEEAVTRMIGVMPLLQLLKAYLLFFKKVLYDVTLFSKNTRALTFQNS